MRVLIVGCGYVGLPLGGELAQQGHDVFGLRRSAADELRAAGITPLVADITRAETLAKLPCDFDWVVNCAATGGGSAEDYRQLYLEGTRNLIGWLGPKQTGNSRLRFVYTSSTGVYGQNDGSAVDENVSTEPTSKTAKMLVETEKALLAGASERNFSAIVLRAAGIYGPGRGYLLKKFLRNEAEIEGDGGRFLNMIHRDDLIRIIIAALERGDGGQIFNAVDDEPVRQRDFFAWLSNQLGKPMPRNVPVDAGNERRRGTTNKRVSNQRLKERIYPAFIHPTFREGYTAEIQRLGLM